MSAIVTLSGVHKVYDSDGEPVTALHDISIEISPGEFVALMGPSGCGKSTLLHIIGAMDRPTQGEVWIEDAPVHDLSEEELTQIRRTKVGFVFQFFHLLPTMTVEENVALPLLLSNRRSSHDQEAVASILETVGLTARRHATPNRLSGGEMQRAALARAVVHNPRLIVADEPTGNLDSDNGRVVLELLERLSAEGRTVVLATHSEAAASYASRRLKLQDGRLSGSST